MVDIMLKDQSVLCNTQSNRLRILKINAQAELKRTFFLKIYNFISHVHWYLNVLAILPHIQLKRTLFAAKSNNKIMGNLNILLSFYIQGQQLSLE